jgi:hypothetical protein
MYLTTLHFIEYVSSKSPLLLLNPNPLVSFSDKEEVRAYIVANKLFYFKKKIGRNLFLQDTILVLILFLKSKDAFFFSNWIRLTLKKISFFKYKSFFFFIKYVLINYFLNKFKKYSIFGIKLKIKGKVGVSGNARKR